MKKGSIFSAVLLAAMLAGGVSACGGSGNTVTLWVGSESTDFYKDVATEFAKEYAEAGGKSYKIKVVGVDTGSTGGQMTSDASACGDIVVTAHDNVGKIVEKGKALAFTDEALINQIKADNSEEFQSVCQVAVGANKTKYFFASPFISQALFLYYNKQYVTADQAKTFEGLAQAGAQAGGKKGFTIVGTDGFNYSFNLLARKASDNSTTLRLYEDFDVDNCYAQGDDEVASLQWAKRVFNESTGGLLPSDSGWAVEVKNGNALSVIGGAWHYKAFSAAIGESNVGITKIPTYTLTSADVSGTTMSPNTVMQGGSFADCKVMLINAAKGEKKLDFEQKLIAKLCSKDVQVQSFVKCNNVPAFNGALEALEEYNTAHPGEINALSLELAKAQNQMFSYSIPQPFVTGKLNTRYYQKQAPDIYKNFIAGTIEDSARQVLYKMQYIWQKGSEPAEIPGSLPADID